MEAAFETSPLCVERVAAPRANLTAKGSDRQISRSGPRRISRHADASEEQGVDEIISEYQ
jgi:hypothetical protein